MVYFSPCVLNAISCPGVVGTSESHGKEKEKIATWTEQCPYIYINDHISSSPPSLLSVPRDLEGKAGRLPCGLVSARLVRSCYILSGPPPLHI